MPIERRPSTIDGIKRTAKEIAKAKGITHAKALDAAAVRAGFQNFAHARKALSENDRSTSTRSRQNPFHAEARALWIAGCKVINPTGAASLSWTGASEIISVLSHFMGENKNHVLLPSGGGLDFESAEPSYEPRCIDFGVGDQVAEIARPKRLTFERIAEEEAESFFLLELDELRPSGAYEPPEDDGPIDADTARYRQREEVVELSPGDYVQRRVWDEGHLGYDEQGYEVPLPRSSRLVVRWMRGKMLFVCKRSLWNLASETYDGRHNRMTAQQIRHVIEISLAAQASAAE